MIKFQKRGLFFLGRLQNKPFKKQGHQLNQYDERVYFAAHKRF